MIGEYAVLRPSGQLMPCTRTHARAVVLRTAGLPGDTVAKLTPLGWRRIRYIR